MNTFTFKMAQKLSAMSLLAAACALGPVSTVNAGDLGAGTVVFGGFDAREKAYYPYVGLIHNFSGNILKDGFLARVVGYDVHYKYDSAVATDGTVDAHATVFEAMVGYQKVTESYALRGYVGLDYEHHRLSPDNTFDSNRGTHVGGKVQGEFETDFAAQNYVGLIATYGSAVDRYWVRARAGRDFGGFVVGPEALVKGDREYNEQRLGAFLILRNVLPALVTVSAGATDSGDRRGGVGPYISMELSTTF
ncbi:MAG: cellulose biosynthesis protein BcsS [Methylotenera sp.]|nr:cellulose biosynthesis protein BcsS [Methylotenera sp.]